MKKILILTTVLTSILLGIQVLGKTEQSEEIERAKNQIIRLHVRAENDSAEEQELKELVRDEILLYTQNLLKECKDPVQAKEMLSAHLSDLQKIGKETVESKNKTHPVTVTLQREYFEYRDYGGFFLPEGEYESLLVTIGSGEGKNWWCVVFPSACYIGAAKEIETEPQQMPSCFRLADGRAEDVKIRFRLWDWICSWFD